MSSAKSGKRQNRRDISKVIKEATAKVENIYTVEKILDKKKEGDTCKYLVKWYGYPKSQATWEPLENLDNVKETVEEFDKTWEEDKEKQKESVKENEPEKDKEVGTLKSKASATEKKVQDEGNLNKKGPKTAEKKNLRQTPEKNLNKAETPKGNKKSESLSKKSVGRKPAEQTPHPNKKVKISKILEEESSIPGISQPVQGHFKFGDKAKKIVSAKSEEPYVICTIDWEIRPDGTLPLRTNLTNKEIKQFDPLLLLEFYESRLKFGNGGSSSIKQNESQGRSAIVNLETNQTQGTHESVSKQNLTEENKEIIQEEGENFSHDENKSNSQKALSQSSRKQSRDDILVEKTLDYSNEEAHKNNYEQSPKDFDHKFDGNDNERHNLGFGDESRGALLVAAEDSEGNLRT